MAKQRFNYDSILADPLFLELKYQAMNLVKRKLLKLNSIAHDRPRVNGFRLDQKSKALYTARHEAGHIMMMWFSDSKVDVSHSTTLRVHPRNVLARFSYKNVSVSNDIRKRSYLFDAVCFHMGGIRSEQRHDFKKYMHQCRRDVHYMCIKAFRLALMTFKEYPRLRNTMVLALMYIKAAFFFADTLLLQKSELFIKFSNELYSKKFLDHIEIANILGSRRQDRVSLYRKFLIEISPKVQNEFAALQAGSLAPHLEPQIPATGKQQNKITPESGKDDKSPKESEKDKSSKESEKDDKSPKENEKDDKSPKESEKHDKSPKVYTQL